jgi:L-lactate utilization protein LutC
LFGSEFVSLAQASSLCGACKEACPVDIDLPKLLTRVRAGQSPVSNPQLPITNGLSSLSTIFLKLYARLTTHPRLFALSQKFASLGTSLLAPFGDFLRLPAFTGWGFSKDMPKFAGKTFRETWRDAKLADGKLASGTSANWPDSASTPNLPIFQTPNLPEQFISELTKVSGNVIQVKQAELNERVIEFLIYRRVQQIHLEPGILEEEKISQAGITVSHTADARIRLGVTKAICGVADTGSILEADGEGDKLQASLLPEIHLAVLHKSNLYPSLSDAIQHVRGTKAAVFITGPSRTADIEMSLTIGVHGPGEMVVFLVDD